MKQRELREQRDRVTEEWYEAIKKFEPVEGADYSWIWDYARYRFEWAFEKTRYVEEKSHSLLKVVLAISAGSWAVFSVLLTSNRPMGLYSAFFAISALVCLVASGYFCLQAASPSDHIYPRGEDKAIQYANVYKSGDAARGRFALIFGDSSEQERFVTYEKGMLVNKGALLAFAAVIAFSLSLLAQLFRLH
jgi:hypothetical protein